MINKYDLFLERVYNINFDTKVIEYPLAQKTNVKNNLERLVDQIEKRGGSFDGEKVAGLLFNAVNLNDMNRSFPFVDLFVHDSTEAARRGEYISVKTSSSNHTLKDVIGGGLTPVGGLNLNTLILFIMDLIELKTYKSSYFQERLGWANYIYIKRFKSIIRNIRNRQHADYAFSRCILIFKLMQAYLYLLRIENLILPSPSKSDNLVNIIDAIVAKFLDKEFDTNYCGELNESAREHSIIIENYVNNRQLSMDNVDPEHYGIGEDIPNIRISYCVVFFDKNINNRVVLNVFKTRAVHLRDIFVRAMNIWIENGYHVRPVDTKTNKLSINYDGICRIFEEDNLVGENVFDTQIKIDISLDRKSPQLADETRIWQAKLIKNVSGIKTNKDQKRILKLINKMLKILNKSKGDEREERIRSFSNFIEEIRPI
jgi:hypothetical protein